MEEEVAIGKGHQFLAVRLKVDNVISISSSSRSKSLLKILLTDS